MSKNIFLFNKIGAQNQMEVNDLTVNQDLKLNGADTDCLLKTDSNSNVVTFKNGPARYLIEVDGTTLKPEWTNNIKVDDITTNTMTINNTTQGDILVIGDGIGSVERLVRGPNNYILCSDDNTFGLNYKSIYQLLNLQPGNLFADTNGFIYSEKPYTAQQPATTSFFTNEYIKIDNVPLVAGRKYKITYNFVNLQGSGQNLYTVNVSTIGNIKSYVTTALQSCENVIHYFTSNVSSVVTISLIASHNPVNENGVITNIIFIMEPLGV
jgi:hypothetical protein